MAKKATKGAAKKTSASKRSRSKAKAKGDNLEAKTVARYLRDKEGERMLSSAQVKILRALRDVGAVMDGNRQKQVAPSDREVDRAAIKAYCFGSAEKKYTQQWLLGLWALNAQKHIIIRHEGEKARTNKGTLGRKCYHAITASGMKLLEQAESKAAEKSANAS